VAPWTLTGRVKVRKISVKKDRLEIQADRLLILYDDKKRGFYHHRSWQKLKIEISSGARQMGVADWKKALERVFVQSEEEWQAALPAPWPAFFEARRQDPSAARLTQAGEENQSNDRPHRVGGSVSPPKCISCPQPEYNEVPRKNRIEGVVVLWAVIDADGRVDNIRIAKPLGAGLDEAALETIQRWRLEPARRDGKPVPAQFTIEVDFHLF
jgi:TonB family protein